MLQLPNTVPVPVRWDSSRGVARRDIRQLPRRGTNSSQNIGNPKPDRSQIYSVVASRERRTAKRVKAGVSFFCRESRIKGTCRIGPRIRDHDDHIISQTRGSRPQLTAVSCSHSRHHPISPKHRRRALPFSATYPTPPPQPRWPSGPKLGLEKGRDYKYSWDPRQRDPPVNGQCPPAENNGQSNSPRDSNGVAVETPPDYVVFCGSCTLRSLRSPAWKRRLPRRRGQLGNHIHDDPSGFHPLTLRPHQPSITQDCRQSDICLVSTEKHTNLRTEASDP